MKTKLLTTFLFFIATATQLQARPSLGGLEQKLDRLLYACPPSNTTPRFVDNGDGTICDHRTGLMWEKKNAGDGFEDLNNPHDVDNTYNWTVAFASLRDGRAYTLFLAQLNGDSGMTIASEQLGGYSDWRLPTSKELQTLLLEPFPCSVDPCIIDPVFLPTATFYWSHTFDAFGGGTRGVNFSNGLIFETEGSAVSGVRAVRGGENGSNLIIAPGPIIIVPTIPPVLTPLP